MNRDRKACLGLCVLVVGGSVQWTGFRPPTAMAAEPPVVACSAERATVPFGGTVRLRAWASSPSGKTPRYVWKVTVGRLHGQGSEAQWDLANVRPGTYAAGARASGPTGTSAECLLRVIVRADPGERGIRPPVLAAPSRETGGSLLLPGRGETPEYGLYSYLLLGSPPSDAARERYLKAIEAYWGLIPEIARLEQYVARRELNIAYLPVTKALDGTISAEWVFENYDYARARSLLRLLPGGNREGPYIVSTLRPLGDAARGSTPSGQYLFQDLSRVPPHLVASWVKEFLNQAAQERFWEEGTGERLALKLRVTVGVLGMGLPEVRKALDTWIAWIR
jgi:hypothetical protein